MHKRLKFVLPIAAVAVISSAAYGITAASAASNTANPTLVDRLVSTFGLDKAKVQAVIDADHSAHTAQRTANEEARLTKAVDDGKLTAAQKTLILAEIAKLDAERQSNNVNPATQTQAQREAHRAAVKTEIDAWAKANNIDASWLMGPMMGGMGHGTMGHRMMDADDK